MIAMTCSSCEGTGERNGAFCEPCWGKGERSCLHGPDGCNGPLAYRNPGYGGRALPLCSAHGQRCLDRERELRLKYGTRDVEPVGFDPLDAGEAL